MLSFEETIDLYKIMDLYDEAYERLPDTEIINRSFEEEPSEFEGILKSKLDKSTDGVMNKTNTVIREKNGRRSILEVKERNSSMSNLTQLLDRGIPESTNCCPSRKESSPESRNNEEINECSSMLNSCHNGLSRERLHEKSVSSDVSILQDYPFLDGFEKTAKFPNCNLMEGVLLTLSSIVNGRINTNPVRFLFNEEQCRSNRVVNKLQLRLAMNIMKQEILKNGLIGKEGFPHLSKGFYYDTVTLTTTAFVMAILGQGNSTKLLEIIMKYVDAYESVTQKKQNKVESSIEDLAQHQREVNLASCVIKTRSGRAVRTPKHITRNFVEVNSKKCDNDVNAVMQDVPVEPVQQLELPTFKRTYSERCRCPTCNKIYLGDERMNAHLKKFPEHNNKTILPKIPELPSAPVITCSSRNRDPRFQCTTCGKIYLGYQRMKKHFGKFPDHTNNELLTKIRQDKLKSKSITSSLRNVEVKYAVDRKKRRTRAHDISKERLENNSEISDLNTWEYMLALVKKKKTEDESFSSTLLREMEFLLKQTRQFSRKIVKPAHGKDIICKNETIEVSEDDPWRYVLGIKPGTYLLVNDDDMESQTDELSLDNELNIANKIGIETLNEALKLFEDNSLQDFVLPGNEFNRNVDEISNSSFPLDFDNFSLSMNEDMNDDIFSNLDDLLH